MYVWVFTSDVREKLTKPTEYAQSMNHDVGGTSNKYGEWENGVEQDIYFGQLYNLICK